MNESPKDGLPAGRIEGPPLQGGRPGSVCRFKKGDQFRGGMDGSERLASAIEEQNRIAMATRHSDEHWPAPVDDPLRWLGSWDLGPLSPEVRDRLKVGLLGAYSEVFGHGFNRHKCQVLFQTRVFDVIAEQFFSGGSLSQDLMEGPVVAMVSDAGVSAGLQVGAREGGKEGYCSFGHYWIDRGEISWLRSFLNPRLCHWRARLLESGPQADGSADSAVASAAPAEAVCGGEMESLPKEQGIQIRAMVKARLRENKASGSGPQDVKTLCRSIFGLCDSDYYWISAGKKPKAKTQMRMLLDGKKKLAKL